MTIFNGLWRRRGMTGTRKQRSARRRRGRGLFFEALESRQLLAGDLSETMFWNRENPFDANRDGSRAPIDALVILNLVNANSGVPVERVKKLAEGRPNLLDYLNDGQVSLVINTPSGKGARTDEGKIRAAAVQAGVPCITTLQAAEAAVNAMLALRDEEMTVQALQDRFPVSSELVAQRG